MPVCIVVRRMTEAETTLRSVLLRRTGAYLLDIAVLFLVLAPLGFVVQRLLGISPPATALEVYVTLVFNFSVPAWAYFTISDHTPRGATLGKRLLGLRTQTQNGERVGLGRAFGRTAVKMVPWEIAHASSFLFAPALGEFTIWNGIGLGVSYALSFGYLFMAWRTQGQRSMHDRVAGTRVTRLRLEAAT